MTRVRSKMAVKGKLTATHADDQSIATSNIYDGPMVPDGAGHAAPRGEDVSRMAPLTQIGRLRPAYTKTLHRLAGMIHAGDFDHATRLLLNVAAPQARTLQALLARAAGDTLVTPVPAPEPVARKSKTKLKPRMGPNYGAKPGFGSRTGKAWKIDR